MGGPRAVLDVLVKRKISCPYWHFLFRLLLSLSFSFFVFSLLPLACFCLQCTTHNTNIRPSAWCKFLVPASEWPQAYALGRAGTGIDVRTPDRLDRISVALQLRNVRTQATASAVATSWNVPVSILKSDIFSRTCRWAVVTTQCG